MRYAYYPGCSLEKTQRGYDVSVRQVFAALGLELIEIDDWNCCGATMYMSVKETVAMAVSARNLALAERMGLDVVAPCSSCYTVLAKTNRILRSVPGMHHNVNEALAEGGLAYGGNTVVRHPLDILMNDVGLPAIRERQKRSLDGLKIAPYYGCQIVRPDRTFDDTENPVLMDHLFRGLGGEVVPFPLKVRCCGGMLMTTFEETALQLNRDLLAAAARSGADVLVTTCPLCHMNLEGYQDRINTRYGTRFSLPVLYFTQLLGIVLGISPKDLGLDGSFVTPGPRISTMMEATYV